MTSWAPQLGQCRPGPGQGGPPCTRCGGWTSSLSLRLPGSRLQLQLQQEEEEEVVVEPREPPGPWPEGTGREVPPGISGRGRGSTWCSARPP